MNRGEKITVIKNALANVVRGGATALIAVIVPPFLTRFMTRDTYAAWALVLQLSAYVSYLDFGIQTAVGRFVAHADERGDPETRDRIVSTAFAALAASGLLALLTITVVVPYLGRLFPSIPGALASQVKIALIVVGGSLAVGLPFSVFNGIFVGLQRYEVPAVIVGVSRLISAVLLILVAGAGGDLVRLSIAVAAINLATYAMQYVVYAWRAPHVNFGWSLVSRDTMKTLFDYCVSLTIWSFAMLLVTGLDVTLVARFQFSALAYYAVAASLVTFLAGLQNAIFNALIPSAAVMHARGDSALLGSMMITATRYGSLLLVLTGMPLIAGAGPILSVWVGSSYAAGGDRLLQVLVIANMIRLSATPYVFMLIGTGEQRLVTLTPLLEGVTNLVASVVLGMFLGAMGVALGTLVGAFVGVGGNFLYNMPRTKSLQFRLGEYVTQGLLRPFACVLPLVIFDLVARWLRLSLSATMWAGSFALAITLVCLWSVGLSSRERQKFRSQLSQSSAKVFYAH